MIMTEKGMKNGGGEQENLFSFSAKALKDRNLGCMYFVRVQRTSSEINFRLTNSKRSILLFAEHKISFSEKK